MSVQQLIKSFTVLAQGLDNPKGISFAPDGSLYVTEAGTGGDGACIPSASGQGDLCYGNSGAIALIKNGQVERVLTGLPSVAFPDGSGAAGPHDIKFDEAGRAYVAIGLAANPVFRDPKLGTTDLGKIIRCNFDTNSWTSIADIAQYQLDQNFGPEIVSNLLSLYIDGNQIVAVDAGANNILSVSTDGEDLRAIATIPEKILVNPVFPGAGSQNFDKGHVPAPGTYENAPPSLPIQSVPTDIVKGADGTYYISEFTGFPFPEGDAKIYQFKSGELKVYADNLTQLIDLAIDTQGNLYALQHMNQSGWKGKPDGALLQIAADGNHKTLVRGAGLESPSGLTIGPDGAFYVINRGGRPGQGQIIKIA